jgi:hypothetical protein
MVFMASHPTFSDAPKKIPGFPFDEIIMNEVWRIAKLVADREQKWFNELPDVQLLRQRWEMINPQNSQII